MRIAGNVPHMRRVVILAGLAGVLVLASIAAVILSREPVVKPFTPELYFPDLEAKAADIRRIEIRDAINTTEIAFTTEGGWILPGKDGYRARYEEIQALVLSLAALERFERKTADKEWLARLLLTDPREDGEATLVRLLDGEAKPVAEILLGTSADVAATSGGAQIYVRAPGEDQVWLARGQGLSRVSADPADWLERVIINVPQERIARAEISPQGAPKYALIRATPEAEDFAVESLPLDRKLKSPANAASVGTVLTDLGLRDVARADRITFGADAPTATFETFNGLVIRVDSVKLGEDTWVRLVPSLSATADDQAKAEAADVERRLKPWVFQIEGWKGAQLATTLESITEPASERSPAASDEAPASSGAPQGEKENTKKPNNP